MTDAIERPAPALINSVTADHGLDAPGRVVEPRRQRGVGVTRLVPTVLTLGFVVGCWAVVSATDVLPDYALPSPRQVAQAMADNRRTLLADTLATATIAFLGLLAAIVLGLVLAVAVVHLPILHRTVMPLVVGGESLPKAAFAPILITWFGIGSTSRVLTAMSLAFFPILINLIRGLGDIDPHLIDVSAAWSASRAAVFRHVRFPSATLALFDALRMAIPLAVVGAIIGEFIASNEGLGHRILVSNARLRTDISFGALVIIGAISMVSFGLLALAERRLTPWKDRRRG